MPNKETFVNVTHSISLLMVLEVVVSVGVPCGSSDSEPKGWIANDRDSTGVQNVA